LITGAGLAVGASVAVSPAAAADLTVDTLTDPVGPGACNDGIADDCSLRQAIEIANSGAGPPDYVGFQTGLSGTLTLTTAAGGEIPITESVYIYGNGPDETTVHAAAASRIFHVDLTTANQEVGIYSLTLTGGSVTAPLSSSLGGAIWNWDADMHVADSVLTGNTALAGGAVYERGYGNSTFVYSTFSGNEGGAILAPAGFGVIAASTITGNTAYRAPAVFVNQYPGGAIYDSTISGNHAEDTSQTGAVEMPYPLLFNTVVANTTGPNAGDVDATSAYAVASLIESEFVNDPIEGGGNLVGQDPQLGSLAMNGGETPTMSPDASSPVVDQGISPADFDQRGFARRVNNPSVPDLSGGNGADIGAVELSFAGGPAQSPLVQPRKPKCKKPKKKGKRASATAKKKKRCKRKKRSADPFAGTALAVPNWPDRTHHHAFRLDR
jgi:hypothetical protein